MNILSNFELFNLLVSDVNSFRNYLIERDMTSLTVASSIDTEMTTKLIDFLSTDERIQRLELNLGTGGSMSAETASIIFGAIAINTSLKHLIVNHGPIEILQPLTNLLRENKALTKITFKYGNLGPIGIKLIAEGLKDNSTLEDLEFNMCHIVKTMNDPARDLSGLQLLLTNCSNIVKLNINNSAIEQNGASMVGDWLGSNPKLQKLNLSYSYILYLNNIASGLQTNTNLCELDISFNYISPSSYNLLAQILQNNATLQLLNLSSNEIEDDGALQLAKGLTSNTSLQYLYLHDNDITNEGTVALAEALKTNKTLTKLNLAINKIRDEGAASLGDMLKQNSGLTHVNLNNNKITDEGAVKLYEGIKYNEIIDLDLTENNKILNHALLDLIAEHNRINEHNKKINSLTLVQILTNHKNKIKNNF